MNALKRSHDIDIDAPMRLIFDYVTNPRSWPEWLAASHGITSPDRPLGLGDTFEEKWHTSREVRLDWRVTACQPGRLWIAETWAEFLGPTIIQYGFQALGQGTRFTRTVRNPDRPRAASPEMLMRMDEEAAAALQNIKRQTEALGRSGQSGSDG